MTGRGRAFFGLGVALTAACGTLIGTESGDDPPTPRPATTPDAAADAETGEPGSSGEMPGAGDATVADCTPGTPCTATGSICLSDRRCGAKLADGAVCRGSFECGGGRCVPTAAGPGPWESGVCSAQPKGCDDGTELLVTPNPDRCGDTKCCVGSPCAGMKGGPLPIQCLACGYDGAQCTGDGGSILRQCCFGYECDKSGTCARGPSKKGGI